MIYQKEHIHKIDCERLCYKLSVITDVKPSHSQTVSAMQGKVPLTIQEWQPENLTKIIICHALAF